MSPGSSAQPASPPSGLNTPTPPDVRFELVDIVRGFALFGVLLANMVWTTQWFTLTDTQRAALPTAGFDRIVQPFLLLLIDYKFYTLFSMLFGLGFAMQLSRAVERGRSVLPVYTRRLAILFLFGVAHAILLWFGDILHVYAVVGFVLLLFRNGSDRALLCWAFGIALAIALLPFFHLVTGSAVAQTGANEAATRFAILTGSNWQEVILLNWRFNLAEYTGPQLQFDTTVYWYLSVLSKFLIGFVIGRRMLLQQPERHLMLYRRLLPWALVVGLVGNAYMTCAAFVFDVWIPEYPSAWLSLTWVLVEVSMLSLSLAYVLCLVLLYHRTGWKHRLQYLAPVGRMALTNYLTQSVFLVVLFYGVGLDLLGKVGSTACVGLSLVLFALQIVVSRWWLRRFRFGPAEWAWRCMTYCKVIPMRLERLDT
jgi:uncharacterized protein